MLALPHARVLEAVYLMLKVVRLVFPMMMAMMAATTSILNKPIIIGQ